MARGMLQEWENELRELQSRISCRFARPQPRGSPKRPENLPPTACSVYWAPPGGMPDRCAMTCVATSWSILVSRKPCSSSTRPGF